MSIAAMAYVWENSQHKGNELILLLAVADFANERGVAWPGIDTLAKRIRVDSRTAQRCLKRVITTGELRIQTGAGPRGCNLYQIVMQASLPMFEEGVAKGPPGKLPRVASDTKRGGIAVSPEPPRTVIKSREPGQAKASPVTACFEAYQHGIKTVHKADYPPSASANGILSQIIRKLGAEAALAVVRAYVSSTKPFYVQRKHSLEILAKDAATIWIEVQQLAGGGGAKIVTVAGLSIEWQDGQMSRMTEYPIDKPEALARRLLKDYASKFATGRARNIHVQVGAKNYPFAVSELRA